ncbi:MAG: hypothetical protein B0D96_08585 [Candidatus Sedimenticola endophacoides]|nr:MAG: hypothetical protein B0D94_00215 [Candidatus Sedimenticola endophacoides]OQX34749.1 MAG: hypothetical protein B0D96_08585 [Candidatus Sedimenticola endophacoides]OQX43013.1 MAG: hypothetical protein B0D89_00140 [Candidatus Sedimenticola endophacoides]OQX43437.1 MAG: hypothetical protein B0D88_04480 [Candidatus Sedimenticola endophacoides]
MSARPGPVRGAPVRRPGEVALNRRELGLLVLLLGLTLAPHLPHLAPGVTGFLLLVLSLRLLALKQPRLQPGRLGLFLLTIGGIATVLTNYPLLIGKSAGVALLTAMLGLKLLELKSRRDLFVAVFLAYFTLITQFLFNQEIWLVLYVLLLCGLSALLIEASRCEHSDSLLDPLGQALRLLLQAAPIMLVLFLFFPRLQGPLWNLGIDQGSAVTGLSDRITLGSISRLIRSPAIAFRADFEGPVPPPQQRYWRGPVLWHSDGRTWSPGAPPEPAQRALQSQGAPIAYRIILEPSRREWLYALDLPLRTEPRATISTDFQVLAERPVEQRITYRALSAGIYHTGALTPDERRRALQLPDNVTPRMRALARQWRQESGGAAGIAALALNHFRREPYHYTLYPPPLGDNPSDEFLFETRRGFCEHYATGFTLLMRLAGVPSRVVTGYQGGELNPLGGYMMIRQYDAHAWSEVWIEDRGWIRIDPTAAIAPERIERTFEPLIDDTLGAFGTPIDFNLPESGLLGTLAQQLRFGWDSLNSGWHRWVLGYTQERQHRLLDLLGLDFLRNHHRLAAAMAVLAGLVVVALGALNWYRTRERQDPAQRAYLRFCHRLGRAGITRRPWQGPRDFAREVAQRRPDLKPAAARITALYISIRYGRGDTPKNRARLRAQIARFRPRPTPTESASAESPTAPQ